MKDKIENKHLDVVVKYFYPIAAGIETNILETYSVLVEQGWSVTVHTSRDTYLEKNSLPHEEEVKGIKVKRYSYGIFGFWPKINWRETAGVCLHNFNIFPFFQIMLFSYILKIFKKKRYILTVTPHGGFNPEWRIFTWAAVVIKKIYHYTIGVVLLNGVVDGIRAVSDWERFEIIKKGVKKDNVITIDNGLEDEAYTDFENKVSDEFKAKIESFGDYIIQIGRVYMIKNYETTIKALAKTNGNLKYIITGPIADQEYKKELDDLISELNLEKRVIFTGVIRGYEKYYLIKNAQMMVHMALWESYCNVIHEGMSQGLPCIVADNTALPFLIKDSQNGFIIETKNHRALSEKINYIYNNINNDDIIRMKKLNRLVGLENSWRSVADKMNIFYQSLIVALMNNKKKEKVTVEKIKNCTKEKKNIFIDFSYFLLCAMILFSVVKGLIGVPGVDDINSDRWMKDGPFHDSQRGRYALTYSVLENDSVSFLPEIAEFAAPDLAINSEGQFVSLFAPGVAYIVMPGYLIGKLFGASQLGVFLTITLFAFLNLVLINLITRRLGASKAGSRLAGIVFLFATPAFAYSTNLFQHHISTFLLLFAIYIMLKWNNIYSWMSILFICSVSVVVDNPNFFILFPIGLLITLRAFGFIDNMGKFSNKFNFFRIFVLLSLIPPLIFFAFFNISANGGVTKISGTLERVVSVNVGEEFVVEKDYNELGEEIVQEEKKAWNFFETRNLLNGFYLYTFSSDRGVLWFSPIILFGFLGLYYLYKKNSGLANLLFSIIGINVLVYTMWGDPYGGWAFGSRYLIPTFAILAICLPFALSKIKKKTILSGIFFIVLTYSFWVNSLGAVSSTANPPKFETPALEQQSGHKEHYTWMRNVEYLDKKGSRSFVYNQYMKDIINPLNFHWLIFGFVALLGLMNFYIRDEKKHD